MAELDKVLIVASQEESAERAYSLVRALRENGYSVDICHIPNDLAGEKKSKIKADKLLTEDTGVSDYKGVVFLDHGGDPKLAVELAKRADEKAISVGAVGQGADILGEAGLLKDKEICANLSEKASKGAKVVDRPAVRCDNIITSSGFIEGFALLFLSALGGKVRKVVRSEEEEDQTKTSSALVLASTERWPSYWKLAQELDKKNTFLIMAEWDDVDFETKKLSQCMLLDTKRNDIVTMKNISLPEKVWYRMPSTEQKTIEDVKKLESVGCINVNSSEALQKMSDKLESCEVLSTITDQGDFKKANHSSPMEILLSGKRWARARYASLFSIRISEKPQSALVSVFEGDQVKHLVVKANSLKSFLKKQFKGNDFIIQKELGCIDDPGSFLEITLRKKDYGWKASSFAIHSSIGRAERRKISGKLLNSAIHLAKCAAVMSQSVLLSPDGLNEVQAKIVFDQDTPKLIRLKPAHFTSEKGTEDISDFLSPSSGPRRWIIERELACEAIWIQPDGMFALKTNDGIVKMTYEKALEYVWKQAAKAASNEVKLLKENASEEQIKWASSAARLTRHRVWTLLEFFREHGLIKFADTHSTVKGWFANLDLPMSERYYEYHEGTEEVIESDQYDQFLKNQPRYNPEYDKTSPDDPAGFYAVFVEPQRGPYFWEQRFTEGNYPIRKMKA